MSNLSTSAGLHRPQHGWVCWFWFHCALLSAGGIRHQEHTAGQLHPEGKSLWLFHHQTGENKPHLLLTVYVFGTQGKCQLLLKFDLFLTRHWHQISFTWRLSSVSLWVNSRGALERHQEPKTEALLEKGPRKSRVDLSSNCSGILLPNRTAPVQISGPVLPAPAVWSVTDVCGAAIRVEKDLQWGRGPVFPNSGNRFHYVWSKQLFVQVGLSLKCFIYLFSPLFSEGDHRDDTPVWRSMF